MRVLGAALVLILLTASSVSANGGGHTPVSICHSGNGKNYTWISPDQAATTGNGHANHDHDVFGLSEADCLAKNATPEPTIEPTVSPTDEPTPTQEPTNEVTPTPFEPTPVGPTPTSEPTVVPTGTATTPPTMEPTAVPTGTVPAVTEEPTDEPVPTTPLPTPTAGDSSTPTTSPQQPAPRGDSSTSTPTGLTGREVSGSFGEGEARPAVDSTASVTTLPDTGAGVSPSIATPVIMAIAGVTLAASAWGVRRKV